MKKTTYTGLMTITTLAYAFIGTSAHATVDIISFSFDNQTLTADGGVSTTNTSLGYTGFTLAGNDGKAPTRRKSSRSTTYTGLCLPRRPAGTINSSNYALRLGTGYNSGSNPNVNNGSSLNLTDSTVGFQNIMVSYDTYASSVSSFQTQTLYYSIDGVSYTSVFRKRTTAKHDKGPTLPDIPRRASISAASLVLPTTRTRLSK